MPKSDFLNRFLLSLVESAEKRGFYCSHIADVSVERRSFTLHKLRNGGNGVELYPRVEVSVVADDEVWILVETSVDPISTTVTKFSIDDFEKAIQEIERACE